MRLGARPLYIRWMKMGWPAAMTAALLMTAGCGARSATSAEGQAAAPPTSATVKAVTAPNLISSPIALAEMMHPDVTIEAVDLGPGIIDGVDHRRAIDNKAVWRISSQCNQMIDDTINVGVFKEAEYQMLVTTGGEGSISDNTLKVLLDCPAG